MSSKPLEHEVRMGKVVRNALHSGSLSSNPVEHEIRLVICETVNLHFPAHTHAAYGLWSVFYIPASHIRSGWSLTPAIIPTKPAHVSA